MTMSSEKPKNLKLEYAGIDLIERSECFTFDIEREYMEARTLLPPTVSYIPGLVTWKFGFTMPGFDLPQEGEVKLVGIEPGPADDFYAEGTASIVYSNVDISAGTIEAVLKPVNAALRFPAAEQRRAGIETEKEQLRRHHELELQRKIATWKDVTGTWMIKGYEHLNYYEDDSFESMDEAIARAVYDVEWNRSAPQSIWQNDRQIFDCDDIISLMSMDKWC